MELTRQLLEVLGRISGLESTYLTLVDFERQLQRILYANNTGDLEIPEGLQVNWSDTLCRRALEGGPASTSEVPTLYPDSAAARDLGIRTYVPVPVVDQGGEIFGDPLWGQHPARRGERRRPGRHGDAGQDDRPPAGPRRGHGRVADQAAELAAANASLERLASTDPLTGLFNRRHVGRELSRMCSFARRRREPVSVVATQPGRRRPRRRRQALTVTGPILDDHVAARPRSGLARVLARSHSFTSMAADRGTCRRGRPGRRCTAASTTSST